MTGFWDNDDATAERMTPDGFVLTGDIGRLDSNGYLYVLDRKDDMIISGGFNIWPAELENVIAHHPDVTEVAVFAAPHDRWGETPAAVCVVSSDPDDAERALNHCRRVLLARCNDEACASPIGRGWIVGSVARERRPVLDRHRCAASRRRDPAGSPGDGTARTDRQDSARPG